MPAIQSCEFNAAFSSLRKANTILGLVVVLCLAVQIGGFCAVEFGKVLECPAPVASVEAAAVPTTAPTTAPSASAPAVVAPVAAAPVVDTAADAKDRECKIQRAKNWRYGLNWTLAATKNIAFAAAVLLFMLGTVAGHLSLTGPGVRGIKQIISSVCWTVILLALLVPWQQVLRPSLINGATFNLGDIVHAQASATGGSLFVLMQYYARFLAYPALAVLVWLMVVVKFAIGYCRLTGPQPATMCESKPAQYAEVK